MNIKICQDCLYAGKGANRNRTCKKYNNIRVQLMSECPMGYNESDIDWVISKANEDSQRGYVLYAKQ